MNKRPVLYVLAGVNGAGKSSVGGHLLSRAGLAWFNPDSFARELVTAAGTSGALPGTSGATVKATPFGEYPGKGRATGGVRAQRFLKGEDTLLVAWVGPAPARAATPQGAPAPLPPLDPRRDGRGNRALVRTARRRLQGRRNGSFDQPARL